MDDRVKAIIARNKLILRELTNVWQSTKQIAKDNRITDTQARYRLNKLLKQGKIIKKTEKEDFATWTPHGLSCQQRRTILTCRVSYWKFNRPTSGE